MLTIALPTLSSEGTTSRNSRPDAATASHTTTSVTMIATRSSSTRRRSGSADHPPATSRRCHAPGLSHFSIRSVTTKNTTLTMMTKQMAA